MGAGTPRSGVRGTDAATGEGHSPAVPKPSSSPAFHRPPCGPPVLSAILRLLHLGVPARTPGHGLTAGQGMCLEQRQDGGEAAGGHKAAHGLWRWEAAEARTEGHPRTETCQWNLGPASPRALQGAACSPSLSLQGNWELQLTSVGVRTTPPSAPPPWGDTGLTPAPTRSLRSIRGGGQPNSQTGHRAQPPPGGSARSGEGTPPAGAGGSMGLGSETDGEFPWITHTAPGRFRAFEKC